MHEPPDYQNKNRRQLNPITSREDWSHSLTLPLSCCAFAKFATRSRAGPMGEHHNSRLSRIERIFGEYAIDFVRCSLHIVSIARVEPQLCKKSPRRRSPNDGELHLAPKLRQ